MPFGVVVSQASPSSPCCRRRPMVIGQVSGWQSAASSIQAQAALGPRKRSGSSAERKMTSSPVLSTSRISLPTTRSMTGAQTSSAVRQVASLSIG
jgi:hypothetical protein